MIKTAIGFLLGCTLCFQLSALPSNFLWALLLLPVTLYFRHVLLTALVLGFSLAAWHANEHLTDKLTLKDAGLIVLAQGHIDSIPQRDGHRVKFLFSPQDDSLPKRIQLSWYHAPKDIPKAGEKWQLRIKVKPPLGTLNPGGFDYERWLFSQRIGAIGYVRKSDDNQRLHDAPDWHIDRLRQSISTHLTQSLPDAQQLRLIKGLSIGLRDDLTDAQWQVLQKTGTNHLLAISGLHIGLAAMIGFFLFRWVGSLSIRLLLTVPAQKIGAIGGFFFALTYALLAGWSIPTQRALVMISVVLVTLLLNRRVRAIDTLAMSLLAVLLYDPFALLNVGFWLSFTAVGVILLTCTGRFPMQRYQWLSIHVWIAIGLIPLLIILFGQFSIAAPLSNVWAVPFVSFLIIPLLLLSLLLLYIWPSVGEVLLHLTDNLLAILWLGLEEIASWPMAHASITGLPLWLLALFIFSMVFFLLPRGMPYKYSGLLVLVPLTFYVPSRPAIGEIHLVLLDVGQGLSVVIETHKHVLVYDTGAKFNHRFDMGRIAVVPYLQSRQYQHIDTLVISHADNDHRGGLQSVREAMSMDTLLSNEPDTIGGSTLCDAGTSWIWDEVRFDILWPEVTTTGNRNNRSCVLKVTAKNSAVLLPGDIEKKTEIALVQRYGDELRSDILVAPHHGSRTSSSPGFINAVSPDNVLFAVGRLNRYGFPKDDVLTRYENRGIHIHRTDHHGAIVMTDTDGFIHWRTKVKKMWSFPPTE